MNSLDYIVSIKAALVSSPLVDSFDVVEEWALPERGYLRVRMRLVNGDFLEASEYFVVSNEICVTERYRHQWMDDKQEQLRRRWDNVEHYPDLPGFPHHVHHADGRVETGQCLGTLELLDWLERESSESAQDL